MEVLVYKISCRLEYMILLNVVRFAVEVISQDTKIESEIRRYDERTLMVSVMAVVKRLLVIQ